MQQQTLTGIEKYGETTRRAQFLAEVDPVAPQAERCAVISPFHPKVSPEGARLPLPLEQVQRVYFLQQGINLSDPAVE